MHFPPFLGTFCAFKFEYELSYHLKCVFTQVLLNNLYIFIRTVFNTWKGMRKLVILKPSVFRRSNSFIRNYFFSQKNCVALPSQEIHEYGLEN